MAQPQNTNHPDYNLYLSYWKQIRVFVKGMKDVQDFIQGVTQNTDPKSRTRNRMYKERGKYTNFPSRTRNALVGSVFRKEPEIELNSTIDYLKDNSNGAGKPLEQLAKHLVTNLIEVGRHGLFVDYGVSAKIVTYSAENIKGWDTDEEGLLTKVELITGKEKEKHLVINSSGVYEAQYYEKSVLVNTITPTKADGSTFDYIPFIICGSVDNSPDVDDMPLWAIVDVTQGHYQNSADYEDILRYLVPTPAVTVPNKSWLDEMLPNGVYTFGDGSIIPLPDGGSAMLLQASENQMHSEAMKHKEEQLVMLGARIISDKAGVEAADTVRIRFSAENSVLSNLTGNASSAIEQAIKWCMDYMNTDGDVTFKLNQEFFDTQISAQEISAQILLLDRQIKSKKDVRDTLRRTGDIPQDRTDEDIDDDIDNEGAGL